MPFLNLKVTPGVSDEAKARIINEFFLFLGRHDMNVSSTVAAEWFEDVKAPEKKLIWFENSAHELMVEEPGKTLFTLVNEVRPIAERADDVAEE